MIDDDTFEQISKLRREANGIASAIRALLGAADVDDGSREKVDELFAKFTHIHTIIRDLYARRDGMTSDEWMAREQVYEGLQDGEFDGASTDVIYLRDPLIIYSVEASDPLYPRLVVWGDDGNFRLIGIDDAKRIVKGSEPWAGLSDEAMMPVVNAMIRWLSDLGE